MSRNQESKGNQVDGHPADLDEIDLELKIFGMWEIGFTILYIIICAAASLAEFPPQPPWIELLPFRDFPFPENKYSLEFRIFPIFVFFLTLLFFINLLMASKKISGKAQWKSIVLASIFVPIGSILLIVGFQVWAGILGNSWNNLNDALGGYLLHIILILFVPGLIWYYFFLILRWLKGKLIWPV